MCLATSWHRRSLELPAILGVIGLLYLGCGHSGSARADDIRLNLGLFAIEADILADSPKERSAQSRASKRPRTRVALTNSTTVDSDDDDAQEVEVLPPRSVEASSETEPADGEEPASKTPSSAKPDADDLPKPQPPENDPPKTDTEPTDPEGKSVQLEEGDEVDPYELIRARFGESSFDWVFRDRGPNGLGIFSMQSASARELAFDHEDKFEIEFGYGIHFTSGPLNSDLSPRLVDLYFNVHWLEYIGENFGIDANFDLGVFTDFEDSARDGWRYPGRAIGFLKLEEDAGHSELTLVGGIESFDTQTHRVIPSGGVVWQPNDEMRFELYYPRPQIKFLVDKDEDGEATWLYFRGELARSSEWAVERSNSNRDIVTLSERRIALGIETTSTKDISGHFMEIGYVFRRELNYRSGIGDTELNNTMMFRMGHRF